MNLVERYLHEVGRYLPRKTREDILVELRSTITDTLEERGQDEAGEENVVRLLKELGEPRKLAASYSGNAQYLIGPELYPLFRMIAGIVVAAVTGAQLLAYGIAVGVGEPLLNPWESLAGILSSIPAALGWLVLTFAILQRTNVRPKMDDEVWDPRSLPEIEQTKTVKRAEHIFSIIAASVILAILTFIPEIIGVVILPKGDFFANPVILQYLGIISLSLIAGVCLDSIFSGRGNGILFAG